MSLHRFPEKSKTEKGKMGREKKEKKVDKESG